MHPKVHNNCMNKSQHTEATRVSVGRKMDKGGTMYKHDGIMLSRAEEWFLPFVTLVVLYSMRLSEVSQTKANALGYHLYVESNNE